MKVLKGISAASGLAMGVACLYTSEIESTLPRYAVDEQGVPREVERLKAALERAQREMRSMIRVAESQFDKEAAGIFNTHLLILSDAMLFKKTAGFIETRKVNAEHAVADVFAEYIEKYKKEKGHFQELTHDFIDARDRILGGFGWDTGKFKCEVGEQRPVIVVAKRLTPSMVLNIPPKHVLAFVTEEGGFTSHATILARSYGVPIIFGVEAEKELDCGVEIIVDGSRGEIVVAPDEKTRVYFVRKIELLAKKKNVCAVNRDRFAHTRAGQRITLKVNISTPEELNMINGMPHDGIGLLRTEFLFKRRESPPSEEEQYRMYRDIFSAEAGPVTVRLLDLGSDKLPPFLTLPENINTDLELRGAMAVETFPEIYVTQARALLRAAADRNVRLLYPMVSDVNDLETFRSIVAKARNQMAKENAVLPTGRMQEGIMIETPAAVMLAGELMAAVDFVNIGSNDLLQYTLAASRGNMLSEKRYHILHPALLKLIEMVAREGRKAGREVCLCGEIASFEEFYPLFLQIGLKSFSVAVSKFNDIKCELIHVERSKDKQLLTGFYRTRSKEEADRYFHSMSLTIEKGFSGTK